MKIIPTLLLDSYKISHRRQYPKGTSLVYSNWTPRSGKYLENVDYAVWFGLQYFVKEYLIEQFNENFFNLSKEEAIEPYKRIVKNHLGMVEVDHLEQLHDLGYLPLKIKALPEGTRVPIRTPMLTIYNTHPDFFWLTNSIETLMSSILWKPCVSATISDLYKQEFLKYSEKTCDNNDLVNFLGHDFSLRGQPGIESGCLSGAAHCLSFLGSDSVPVIPFLEKYYNANSDNEIIALSVPASEHSVECLHSVNGNEVDEYSYVDHMLNTYPDGIVSVVSDGFDYWKMLVEVLPHFKERILSRNGKYVVRPDSGDPVKIICGDPDSHNEYEKKGSVQLLYEIFGGKINSKGYIELDDHIGLIYGDSITRERQKEILEKLKNKGFSSNNVVLGIGSYTFTMTTRDTLGLAMKATYGEVNGLSKPIFKDPKTDDGVKKSAKGLIRVNEDLSYTDECSWEEESQGLLETVFEDGKLVKETSLKEIRKILK